MAATNPVITETLANARLAQASHGSKGQLVASLCESTGLSRATVYRKLREATVRAPRRQRSDAGKASLTREEALLISALVLEGMRKNGKHLYTIASATATLRANGEIGAWRVHPQTGECTPLSTSAIARAMRGYGLHPEQLLQPPPARELKSLHPNHAWQIDASLCVLYYLETSNPREMGLQVMDERRFYKNKPKNLKRVENKRVWSYEITDHNSGAIFLRYVYDGENAANLCETFLAAIQQRGSDPFYGVPFIVMMDMGSANTSGMFKNLARRLQIELLPHAPENARATGQVENARNIIERDFESGLRLSPVYSLQELNERAARWQRWYNATKEHSRHGNTRYGQWQTIRPEQLRIAPPPELCRQLLTHTPVQRKVNPYLRVEFEGAQYDVSAVPRIMVGEKVWVTYNPYNREAAFIVDADEQGKEQLHAAPLVAKGQDGFSQGAHANVIGQDWQRPAHTRADQHRQEIELLVMQAQSLQEAAAKRKAKALPFGGRIDPEKHIRDATLPLYLPSRGTALEPAVTTAASVAPERTLTHFEAAQALRAQHGVEMDKTKFAQLAAWHPNGVPEGQLPELAHKLAVRATLRVVGGH